MCKVSLNYMASCRAEEIKTKHASIISTHRRLKQEDKQEAILGKDRGGKGGEEKQKLPPNKKGKVEKRN